MSRPQFFPLRPASFRELMRTSARKIHPAPKPRSPAELAAERERLEAENRRLRDELRRRHSRALALGPNLERVARGIKLAQRNKVLTTKGK